MHFFRNDIPGLVATVHNEAMSSATACLQSHISQYCFWDSEICVLKSLWKLLSSLLSTPRKLSFNPLFWFHHSIATLKHLDHFYVSEIYSYFQAILVQRVVLGSVKSVTKKNDKFYQWSFPTQIFSVCRYRSSSFTCLPTKIGQQ